MITKKQVAEYIKNQLRTNRAWVERAIVVLYMRQTQSERCASVTIENNGIGFSGTDAQFLSSLAEWISKGRDLSDGQLRVAHKIVPKYWAQVLSLIPSDKLDAIKGQIAAQNASLTPKTPNFENSVIANLCR